MSGVVHFAVVNALPGTPAPNTQYFIITGPSTFTIVKTDASGNPATLSSTAGANFGTTYTDVTASRALGTAYTNSSGNYLQILVSVQWQSGTNASAFATIGGVDLAFYYLNNSTGNPVAFIISALVPPGATYKVSGTLFGGSALSLGRWSEM